MLKDALPLRSTIPVGDDFLCVGVDISLTDGIALLLTGIENMKVLNTVAG